MGVGRVSVTGVGTFADAVRFEQEHRNRFRSSGMRDEAKGHVCECGNEANHYEHRSGIWSCSVHADRQVYTWRPWIRWCIAKDLDEIEAIDTHPDDFQRLHRRDFDRDPWRPHDCAVCGFTFYVAENHRHKYCGPTCRLAADAARKREARARREPIEISCDHCGETIEDAARSTRRYCSGRCRIAAHRKR